MAGELTGSCGLLQLFTSLRAVCIHQFVWCYPLSTCGVSLMMTGSLYIEWAKVLHEKPYCWVTVCLVQQLPVQR